MDSLSRVRSRGITCIVSLGATIVAFGCGDRNDLDVGSVTTQRSALSTSFPPHLTIPVYFGADSSFDTQWSLIDGVQGGTLIVNEGSGQNDSQGGPGTAWDSDLSDKIAAARTAGWLILGYVDDIYDRAAADIQADIMSWANFYGTQLDGIFFDEAERDPTQFDIGKSIYLVVFTEQVVESYHAVFNWGTTPREHYVNCVGTIFDTVNDGSPMVSFGSWETSESHYTATNPDGGATYWDPPSWLNNYRADHFIHIIHDAPAEESIVSTIASLMQTRNASSVYITNFREACTTTTDCNVPDTTCVSGQCLDSGGYGANVYGDLPASALWTAESTTFVPSNGSMSFPSSTADPTYFSDCPGEIAWCSHDVCGQGSPLTVDCDASWNDCTRTVCTSDPHCCATTWDAACVSDAMAWCSGITCPVD
ncbi:MAG TPA: spherulation-specific family 4 protein [Polyangia bacterium]